MWEEIFVIAILAILMIAALPVFILSAFIILGHMVENK